MNPAATHNSIRPTAAVPCVRQQIEAMDAWNTSLHKRQQLHLPVQHSREAVLDAARRRELLDHAQRAMLDQANQLLARDPSPMAVLDRTAVVAHRHEWFAHKLAAALTGHGVRMTAVTENGADALGIVVAEQPDLLLVGESLEMLTGQELLVEAAPYAHATVLAAQAGDGDCLGSMLDAGAQTVFSSQIPPADVADQLSSLLASRNRRSGWQ